MLTWGKRMLGPHILARTMTSATRRGKATEEWQYHSRSDNHSKVACWAVVFDMLRECTLFKKHASEGKIGFGINYVMVGKLNKTLDLVICAVPSTRSRGKRRNLATLAAKYSIQLSDDEKKIFKRLPEIQEETKDDISEVLIALEAKACMTEHSKSIPRLHAEILATGFLAKQAAPTCITVSYTLVNAAESFISPGNSKNGRTNEHAQPRDAAAVVEMLGNAIPLVPAFGGFGYDVLGVTVVDCKNDGSPVTVLNNSPAPKRSDFYHYEQMIRKLSSAYSARYSHL
jgi:hypothetical protein